MHLRLWLIAGLLPLVLAMLGGCIKSPESKTAPENTGTAAKPASSPALDQHDNAVQPYSPQIDPANFVQAVDNPYWPLAPGTNWTYRGEEETVVVVVLAEKREVMGVDCTVVRDTVYENGAMEEDTYDWYAQDSSGNVWYFGEDSWTYEAGEKKSHTGSWEAGIDGALPGIVMHAEPPAPGKPYYQEYYPDKAMDMAELVSTGETVTVPFGFFDNCRKYREFSALEPGAVEYKYYAEGTGVVLETDAKGGDRLELISMNPPGAGAEQPATEAPAPEPSSP